MMICYLLPVHQLHHTDNQLLWKQKYLFHALFRKVMNAGSLKSSINALQIGTEAVP
jgi:hypothetical protein